MSDTETLSDALTDEEQAVLGPDARSIWDLTDDRPDPLLPEWYMPTSPVGVRQAVGWRRVTAYLVIASFLLVAAAGLCTTYGEVTRL